MFLFLSSQYKLYVIICSSVSFIYFIGSCLDGEEIVKALKDDSKIEGYYKSASSSKKSKSKSSKSSKSNKLIWSIEKVDKSKKLFEDDFIGQRIIAYMDTFYEPTEENLRAAIQILSYFYKVSCLKINVTKTHAVWFGPNYNSNVKL